MQTHLSCGDPNNPIHAEDGYNPLLQKHRYWMRQALAAAVAAGEAGEVPVAALILDPDGQLLTQAQNRRQRDRDPTAHAEILALRQAGHLRGHWNLSGCTLYVTLEPCPMCAGAIILARPQRLVYGADDPKTGAIRTVLNLPDSPASNHKLEVWGGILEQDCRNTLQDWFTRQRSPKVLLKSPGLANQKNAIATCDRTDVERVDEAIEGSG